MTKDQLYRYFIGEASQKEIHEVKLWAEASEENADILRRERQLLNAIVLGGHIVAVDLNAEEYHRDTERSWYTRFGTGRFLRYAAGIIVLIGSTWLLSQYVLSQQFVRDTIAMQVLNVPLGQHADILLPDSTHVWLNSGSTLKFPKQFSSSQREVHVNGEAYFKVRHDEDHPFVVKSDRMTVKVLGTEFQCHDYSNIREVETALLRGRVTVSFKGDQSKKTYMLTPGYRIKFDGKQVRQSAINDYNSYRWREGLYSFTNKHLDNIFCKLEELYGVRIVNDNYQLNNIVLTGKLRINDGLLNALEVLRTQKNFQYEYNGDKHTVKIYQ